MSEYIEREAFLEHMKRTSRYFDVKFDVEEFPAADVAPVVRCKECAFYSTDEECQLQTGLDGSNPDSFCSYGERKEGAVCDGGAA